MTSVANQLATRKGSESASRPITRGFDAIIMITAINGRGENAIHHGALIERLDGVEGGEIEQNPNQRRGGDGRITGDCFLWTAVETLGPSE